MYIIGDTVFQDRWQTKYVQKIEYINHTDTVCKIDSIAVPYEVVKTKTKTDYTGWILAILTWAVMIYNVTKKKG